LTKETYLMSKKTIEVQGLEIRIEPIDDKDYVSLTDIAKQSDRNEPKYLIRNWLKNKNTLDFLIAWESLHNPNFDNPNHSKGVQMDPFRIELMRNGFIVTPKKWIEKTNAIGIISKAGRYGGTYAHKEIALDFCGWLSPSFKVFLYKAFNELLEAEYQRKNLEWHISKITDNVDEIRNLLDTIPGQSKAKNRLNYLEGGTKKKKG